MEKKGSGLGLVFVLIIILLIVGIIISTMDFTKNTYTRGKLEEDIANGEVVKVTVNQRQNSNGGSVKLCCLQAGPKIVFEITKVCRIFEIFDTEEAALAAFSSQG